MDMLPHVREQFERICNSRAFKGTSDTKRQSGELLKLLLEANKPLQGKDILEKASSLKKGTATEDPTGSLRQAITRLRKDLKKYYDTEGQSDTLFFDIQRAPFHVTISVRPADEITPLLPTQAVRENFNEPNESSSPDATDPLISSWYLGQIDKKILSFDAPAQDLLNVLKTNTRIVSIVTPAGFGKTALMVRTIQKALVGDDLKKLNGSQRELAFLMTNAGLNGIAVLNAAQNSPLRVIDFAHAIDRLRGRKNSAPGISIQEKIQVLLEALRYSGRLWIVVENAENCFADGTITNELRSLLDGWCAGIHEAKLILLSRFAVPFPPACHASLPAVESSLSEGLPCDAAISLMRRNLRAARFRKASHNVLRNIVERLHRMPIAIEAFAGYVNARDPYIRTLDVVFAQSRNLLQLFQEGQRERFFPQIIREQVETMAPMAFLLFRVVAWADMPVPLDGLVAIEKDCGTDEHAPLTMLQRSNLLTRVNQSSRSAFTMHALIRAAAQEVLKESAPLDLFGVAMLLREAGMNLSQKRNGQSEAITLLTLSLRGLRELEEMPLPDLRELEEATGRTHDKTQLTLALAFLGKVSLGYAPDEDVENTLTEAVLRVRWLAEQQDRQDFAAMLPFVLMDLGKAQYNQNKSQQAENSFQSAYDLFSHRDEAERTKHEVQRATAKMYLALLHESESELSDVVVWLRYLVEDGHTQAQEDLDFATLWLDGIRATTAEDFVAAYRKYEEDTGYDMAWELEEMIPQDQTRDACHTTAARAFEIAFHPDNGSFHDKAVRCRLFRDAQTHQAHGDSPEFEALIGFVGDREIPVDLRQAASVHFQALYGFLSVSEKLERPSGPSQTREPRSDRT